jgi:hypothetical protein
MKATAARNIRRLFGKSVSELNTETEYKAFQLAIWEIVRDSEYSKGFSFSTGTFKTSLGSDEVREMALCYLNNLGDVEARNLVVLTRDGKRDQIGIVKPAPAPPGLVLAACGILPVVALRRRLLRPRSERASRLPRGT